MTIANCQIVDHVCRTAGSDLYRARHLEDAMPLLVKLLPSEPADAAQLARFRREYTLLESLNVEGIARPRALVEGGGYLAALLEDFEGESLESVLARSRIDFVTCLQIACNLADALAGIEAARVIHRNIQPANILVVPATGAALLVDVSNATTHEVETISSDEVGANPADWAYVSPEQTGRLNRPIDYRSDLYSLGILLYRLLTGQLPFQANDPLEWTHCHIARMPVPPTEITPTIPPPVSDIVMRLLAKLPEDRYQSMRGLRADLDQSLLQWRTSARVEPFALGAKDIPERFRIPKRLYGRDSEAAALLASFEQVMETGRASLATVAGYSGIGKSALVDALRKPIVEKHGYFVSGKFDQFQRNIPYATIVQAFRELVQQLLAENEARIGEWRQQVQAAVGANGQLIVDVLPMVEFLIGKQPPVPSLPPAEAQNRFRMVLRQFISVFARHSHPLVLFLDDLQWIDAASLALVEHLIVHPDIRSLLLIGAYRDNEVGTSHPLMKSLDSLRTAGALGTEIKLGPLPVVHLNRLVADTFHAEPALCEPVTRLVHERTKGNPFFFTQFLDALNREGLLRHDAQYNKWHGNLDQIKARDLSDDVVVLMVEKLRQLPVPTQEALQLAACLGNRFDLRHLAVINRESESEAGQRLAAATSANLIMCARSGAKFLHDRIQQAAYSLVTEGQRAEIHLRIGRALLTNMTADELDEHLFDIAGQFNRGAAQLIDDDEKTEAATINLRAGRKSKASAAYVSACVYLSTGMALLDEGRWHDNYDLMFDLWLERAECEFLCGQFDISEQLIKQLLVRGASRVDLAAVYHLKIQLHVVKSENPQAVDSGLECLRLFGVDIPAHPDWAQVQAEYEAVWRNLDGRTIESLIDLPLMTDPERQAAIRILSVIFDAAYFTDLNLFCLHLCRIVAISIQHGMSGACAQAYAWFGQILGAVFHRYREGYQFTRLACDLVETHAFLADRPVVYYAMGNVAFWTQPVSSGIEFHRLAFRAATEVGSLATACYSMIQPGTDLLLRNDPLDTVWRETEKSLEFIRKAGYADVVDMIVSQQRFIAAMQGRTNTLSTFSDAQFEEAGFEARLTPDRNATMICWYWLLKLKAKFLSGDYAEAMAASDKTRAMLWATASRIESLDYQYYAALTLTALYEDAPADQQPAWRESLKAHEEQLREWADIYPPTFLDKQALVSAEIARIEGRTLDAMGLFERAIQAARENRFVQNEGLANELAGRFYLRLGLETNGYAHLRAARTCFAVWGAYGKVAQLEERYPRLAEPEGNQPATATSSYVRQLDATTVVKASQALTGEIELPRLITRLMTIALQTAGADRGLLIVPQADEYRVEAEARVVGNEIVLPQRPSADLAAPRSLLRYVMHTRESMIIDDAAMPNIFSEDDYVVRRAPRSIFCLPLVRQGTLGGLLYLENTVTSHVFTADRTALLELLASQAAIALENTRLYRDLQEREAKVRRLVDANIVGIFMWSLEGESPEDTDAVYYEANDAFVRMVGYDRDDFASGRVRRSTLTPPEWRERTGQAQAELLKGGTMQPYEKEYLRKDGTRVPVLVGAAAFEGMKQGVSFILDLTERKRAEAEMQAGERRYREAQNALEHANRVSTIGQLVASITHEIRQPLAASAMNAQAGLRWLSFQPPQLEEARQTFDLVIKDATRAREVANRIRSLVKNAPPRKELLQINEAIAEVIALTRVEAEKNNVSVRTELAGDLPMVEGDRIQLQQVMLNLVLNAIEAMSAIGEGARELIVSSGNHDSGDVLVSVGDSGPGFAAENSERLFEPFYTTKAEGMGMGLSICRSIVDAHGGRLWVTANVPRGAVFQFTVPGSRLAEQRIADATKSD
ncbi:AAA family ATPase [Paraburkholderia sp. CNPSo 3274]|uniref:trifunctional serine/threonine-protein kinase/ATP-binding protein/sensor histidine kinase n=1 Tax=Paraburkholderia sp. CNPSo 3274 TaxID=2940932 RepID=UPI0020B66080|nr:trifunctional serine/threonine-protein kinase/ATP-binding protein/sensor histidine kinase [Paraburkholderia sp. CNPSo 3274]MCP3705601.1 AAA family ATPase [Paraburkholderia sp. CNPSo 3274]